jgi:hypothetical protein
LGKNSSINCGRAAGGSDFTDLNRGTRSGAYDVVSGRSHGHRWAILVATSGQFLVAVVTLKDLSKR